jgi:hypothetical protein
MEQILAFEAEQGNALERRRQSDADRQSRKREADKSRDITLRHSDSSLTGASMPVEGNLLPQKTEQEESKKEQTAQARDLAEFNAELSPRLDADRLKALVKHRRAKRAANTGHAARLFIAAADACGISMPEAVDTCISRNWITVKPEWLEGRSARGSPSKQPTASEILRSRMENFNDANVPPERPYLIAAR